jgi:hypothetical protein
MEGKAQEMEEELRKGNRNDGCEAAERRCLRNIMDQDLLRFVELPSLPTIQYY